MVIATATVSSRGVLFRNPISGIADVSARNACRGASVAVMENGRIKRFTDYYDFASFCRAGSAQKNNK